MLVPGQVYETAYTVYDQDAEPGTPILVITKPDGTPVTPAPVPSEWAASGRDYTTTYDYLIPGPGLYGFTWSTAAPGTGRPTDWVTAAEYRSIISLADAKDYLDLRDTNRDEVLLGMLNGITKLIERRIGSCVIRTVTGEWIPGTTRDMIRLPSGPVPDDSSVTSITSVYAGGPSWTAADLIVNPAAGTVLTANQQGFWQGPWRWTGTAGRLDIPADVLEGARMALWDLWAVQRGVTADQAEPGLEEVSAYEAAVPPGWQLPPRVLQLIDGERVPGFA